MTVLIGEDPALPTWARDDNMTFELLQLAAMHDVPADVIAGWTDQQCRDADEWAAAVHFRASDNDIEVPPVPPHVASWPAPGIGDLF